MRNDRSYLSFLTFRPSNGYFLRQFISTGHSSLRNASRFYSSGYPLHLSSYRHAPRRGGFIRFTGTGAFQCLDGRQSEKDSPPSSRFSPEISSASSSVRAPEKAGFIIYAHSQGKRIVQPSCRTFPRGIRGWKVQVQVVQVETGRRTIMRARVTRRRISFTHAS